MPPHVQKVIKFASWHRNWHARHHRDTAGGGADVQTDETPSENHMREATGVGAEGGQFTVQTVAWADQMRDLGAREGAGTYKCQR